MTPTQTLVESELDLWTPLGSQRLADGTLIVGKVPHVAPLAWFHEVYAPLSGELIEKKVATFPRLGWFPYRAFLSELNGCHLFSGAFWLLGTRTSHRREPTVHLPWDVQNTNWKHEKLASQHDALVIGGGTFFDNEVLYLENKSGAVQAFDRASSTSLFGWNSVSELLRAEIARLLPQFDPDGRAKASCPTSNFVLPAR